MGTKDQTQAIIDAQERRQAQKRGADLREEMIKSQTKGEEYRAEHAGADQITEVRPNSHTDDDRGHERGTH